jgi:hypothetical protein
LDCIIGQSADHFRQRPSVKICDVDNLWAIERFDTDASVADLHCGVRILLVRDNVVLAALELVFGAFASIMHGEIGYGDNAFISNTVGNASPGGSETVAWFKSITAGREVGGRNDAATHVLRAGALFSQRHCAVAIFARQDAGFTVAQLAPIASTLRLAHQPVQSQQVASQQVGRYYGATERVISPWIGLSLRAQSM